jgi:hypothetical protein
LAESGEGEEIGGWKAVMIENPVASTDMPAYIAIGEHVGGPRHDGKEQDGGCEEGEVTEGGEAAQEKSS